MLNTLKYVALSLVRDKGIMIWALAFPIVLSTCFIFMFDGLDELDNLEPVTVAVVTDENYDDAEAFKAFLDAVAVDVDAEEPGQGGDVLFRMKKVASDAEAAEAVAGGAEGGSVVGYITLDAAGLPGLHVKDESLLTDVENANAAILTSAMDIFVSKSAVVNRLVEENPQLLRDPAFAENLFGIADVTEQVSVTYNPPKESVRYYFALLGMAALFGAQAALTATVRLLPNMGPLGARRELGGTPHVTALLGTLLASWLVSLACLLVAYLFIRFVAGVDFAGRDGGCVLAIAASSLMATSLGTFLGSVPKIPTLEARGGVLTMLVCFGALFAGLYGQPTMELADDVAAMFPWSQVVNPAVQISEAFYSLCYYDTLSPLLGHLCVLLVMTVVLFALSATFLRKKRYASL